MASRIEMVELNKGFVVNFELSLNLNLIVSTTFLMNTLIIESILLFYNG